MNRSGHHRPDRAAYYAEQAARAAGKDTREAAAEQELTLRMLARSLRKDDWQAEVRDGQLIVTLDGETLTLTPARSPQQPQRCLNCGARGADPCQSWCAYKPAGRPMPAGSQS